MYTPDELCMHPMGYACSRQVMYAPDSLCTYFDGLCMHPDGLCTLLMSHAHLTSYACTSMGYAHTPWVMHAPDGLCTHLDGLCTLQMSYTHTPRVTHPPYALHQTAAIEFAAAHPLFCILPPPPLPRNPMCAPGADLHP